MSGAATYVIKSYRFLRCEVAYNVPHWVFFLVSDALRNLPSDSIRLMSLKWLTLKLYPFSVALAYARRGSEVHVLAVSRRFILREQAGSFSRRF